MAYIAFGLFSISLFCSVLLGINILWPLAFGSAIFAWVSIKNGLSSKELFNIYIGSAREIFPVLLMLTVAGTLTASWRISGTITYLICLIVDNLNPTLFYLWIYLSCMAVITLIGSALGTISMVGTVFVVLAQVAGLDTFIASGAVLSGTATGCRWSPFAPSQVLLKEVVGIQTMDALGGLWRTARIPFAVTCGLYMYISLTGGTTSIDTGILDGMRQTFVLSPWLLIPPVLQLSMALARQKTVYAMFISSLTAYILAYFCQDTSFEQMWAATIHGYAAPPQASQLSGGGIPVMLTPIFILLLASPYARLLKTMGLLDDAAARLPHVVKRYGLNRTILVLTGGISAFACNPLLTIITMLPLCKSLNVSNHDTAVILVTDSMAWGYTIPWSLVCLAPFGFLQTDARCLPYAFFPFCMLIYTAWRRDLLVPKKWIKKAVRNR